MQLKRIETPAEGNPLHPLPPDYESLTEEGQRLARVNACRQWLVPSTSPEARAHSFISSLLFFEHHYLHPDPETDFNPMFFDDEPVPTPAGHLAIYREWATSPASICVAPRGYAKSSCIRKSILMQMLSRPGFSFIYATSTNDNAKQTGQIIKLQFSQNQRIHDDFSPETEGRLVPRRGEASWGTDLMYLRNGSWFRAISAESRQRGGRPFCYVLDDPEYDPKASTSLSILRAYMDRLLFRIVAPMLTRPGTSVRWLATFVSRRHYAWHAMETREDAGAIRAADPRFDYWSRMLLQAAYDRDGIRHSCWPEMWPVTTAARLSDPTTIRRVSLEEIEQRIGRANFLSEYMGRPGEGGDTFFPVLTEPRHGYTFHSDDGLLETAPHSSNTEIRWQSQSGEHRSMRLRDFLRFARTFMCIDTSYTHGPDSDAKVATVMACTPDNELFVLDMWARQAPESELIRNSFRLADLWRIPTLHPEVVRESASLWQQLEAIVAQRATEMTGTTHLPAIRPLRVGMASKTSKISSLLFRLEHGLLKLPLWRGGDAPWSHLLEQFAQFNPEASDGGLQHDDHIDTLAMSSFVLRSRPISRLTPDDPLDSGDPLDRIISGEYVDKATGLPIAFSLDPTKIDANKVSQLLTHGPTQPNGSPDTKA